MFFLSGMGSVEQFRSFEGCSAWCRRNALPLGRGRSSAGRSLTLPGAAPLAAPGRWLYQELAASRSSRCVRLLGSRVGEQV